MYADMVVLDKNLLTAEESELPSTQVEMTFVGGELKYTRDQSVAQLIRSW